MSDFDGIYFQSVQLTEIPFLQDLAKKTWNETYKRIISQGQIDFMLLMMFSTEKLTQEIEDIFFHNYFICYQGEKVGFLCLKEEKKTVLLSKLYLLDAFKRKGIGKEALSFVGSFCKKNDFLSFYLRVNKHNPAVEFYQKCGMEIIREDILEVGNNFIMDDYILEKKVE